MIETFRSFIILGSALVLALLWGSSAFANIFLVDDDKAECLGPWARTSADTVADIALEVLLNASDRANFLAHAGVIGERLATTQKARATYLRAKRER